MSNCFETPSDENSFQNAATNSQTSKIMAFAKISYIKDNKEIFNFYIQNKKTFYGNKYSPSNTNTLHNPSSFIHVDNCPCIQRLHLSIEFVPSIQCFQLKNYSKKGIVVNGFPCITIEFLSHNDEIEFVCPKHNHKLRYLLPKNIKPKINFNDLILQKQADLSLNYNWSHKEKSQFITSFCRFGFGRPAKIRYEARIFSKSTVDVQNLTFHFLYEIYLLSQESNLTNISSEKEYEMDKKLLEALIRKEKIEQLFASEGKQKVERLFKDFPEVIDRLELILTHIRISMFINELVHRYYFEGKDFSASIFKMLSGKETPSENWSAKDDKKLVISVYKFGLNSFEKISKSIAFCRFDRENKENKLEVEKLSESLCKRDKSESKAVEGIEEKDFVIDPLKVKMRLNSIFELALLSMDFDQKVELKIGEEIEQKTEKFEEEDYEKSFEENFTKNDEIDTNIKV